MVYFSFFVVKEEVLKEVTRLKGSNRSRAKREVL